MPEVLEFIKARLEEEVGLPRSSRRLGSLSTVDAVRKILAIHEAWPVLVETEPTMEPAHTTASDWQATVYRIHQKLVWTTTQEYRKRFGDEPPTTPILAALAAIWDGHPDFDEAWRGQRQED